MSWSSQWSLSFWIPHQYPICIPLLPHSCYMPCRSHPPSLYHSNYTNLIYLKSYLISQKRSCEAYGSWERIFLNSTLHYFEKTKAGGGVKRAHSKLNSRRYATSH
jgi:hypothetical protein